MKNQKMTLEQYYIYCSKCPFNNLEPECSKCNKLIGYCPIIKE